MNTKFPKKFTLCICFQVGNSFVNTKVPRKFTLCIRFQLGNSFVNTKVQKKVHFMYSFSVWQFIWECLGILIRQFSISFRCLFFKHEHQRKTPEEPMKTDEQKQ